jgi:hypothetical protein
MLILIASLALLVAACGGGDDGNEQSAAAPVPVTVAGFNANPADFVGKTVVVTGTVDHVCKHGGKRMFIMGDDPADRVKIESGDAISAFDVALEGSDVRVVGIVRVQEMDEAYLDSWEAEATTAADGHGEGEAGEEHAGEGGDHAGDLQQIAHLRQQLADSGEETLAFYHLDCVSYEEL